jgi:hypothetical protein
MQRSSTRRQLLTAGCVGVVGLTAGCTEFGSPDPPDAIQLAVVNDDDRAHEVRLLMQSEGGGVLDERLTVESGSRESVGPYELRDPQFESSSELLAETEAGAARKFAFGVGADTGTRSVLVRVTEAGEIEFERNAV